MKTNDGRLSQRHPRELLNKATGVAQTQGRDLTYVVRQLLYAYVRENTQPQAEESLGIEQA